MKRLIIAACLILLANSILAQTTVHVHAKKFKKGLIMLELTDQSHKIKLNEENRAELVLEIKEPTWAKFSYYGADIWLNLFLIPGKEITIEFDAIKEIKGVPNRIMHPLAVKCLVGGMNEFLLRFQLAHTRSHIAPFTKSDVGKDGDMLSNRLEELTKRELLAAKVVTIPSDYRKHLESYIRYYLAHSFLNFQFYYIRNDVTGIEEEAYYDKIESLIVDSSALFPMRIYREYVQHAIYILAHRNNGKSVALYEEALEKSLSLESTRLKKFLISNFVYEGIHRHGAVSTQELERTFLNTFEDNPKAKEDFNAFLIPKKALVKGKPSLGFNYPDVNGKMISLESLKGKYVYIDFWATWCGPCRAEFPFLKKLEEEYMDKDIHFVGISVDEPKKAALWKKTVEKLKLGGIQLHINGDERFADAYQVEDIPRYILLDKEGKIVSANAPRPSSKEIKIFLESLKL